MGSAELAGKLINMNTRHEQEAVLNELAPEKRKSVLRCVSVLRDRQKYCKLNGKVFWL